MLVAAGLIAGLLFATDMFGDKPKSASDPAPAVATPKLAPSPSPVVKTPDPAPVETPVPEPSATPTPSYQFIRLGISIERLSQSEIDDLLLAGVKVNDGVRVTASAGRVPGLSPGTALGSDWNGGPARGGLGGAPGGAAASIRWAMPTAQGLADVVRIVLAPAGAELPLAPIAADARVGTEVG